MTKLDSAEFYDCFRRFRFAFNELPPLIGRSVAHDEYLKAVRYAEQVAYSKVANVVHADSREELRDLLSCKTELAGRHDFEAIYAIYKLGQQSVKDCL